MRKTWKINGAYAAWRLTVDIEAPEEPADYDVPQWPTEKLSPVVEHFIEAVNYYEISRDAAGAFRFG